MPTDCHLPPRQEEAASEMGKLQAEAGSIYSSRWEQLAPYIAEYVGTFVLTLTFLYNYTLTGDVYWARMSNAFMVAAIVFASKHISGANLNPSVSIALCLAGRLRPRVCGFLCLAQVLGASSAAFLRHQAGINHDMVLGPDARHHWAQVGLIEVLYSSMLCFTYLNCVASKQNNPTNDQNGFGGLVYGLCFVAGGYAAKGIANTVMNSAIAVGLGIADANGLGITSTGIGYFVYDVIGALVGVGAYRVVRPQEFPKDKESVLDRADSAHEESSQLAAEFIGTYYVMCKMSTDTGTDLGPQALGTGAAIMSMSYALRSVSGAHFNPAVTLAVRAIGRGSGQAGGELQERRAIFYSIAQVLGGIAAASTAALIHPSRESGGPDQLISDSTPGQIMVAEVAFTFFLCYAILTTSGTSALGSTRSKQNNIAGFVYGSCIISSTFAVGNISGSLLNPASVVGFIGLGLMNQHASLLPYIFYQVLGAVLAGAAFLVTHAQLHIKDANDADSTAF
mmetsp:Transcript_60677/g.109331  ORF Transcript_60677/g.109331 Transcript_60677/m.109331 type:complete len:508 (+) Transcript_60677:98-1621(+)